MISTAGGPANSFRIRCHAKLQLENTKSNGKRNFFFIFISPLKSAIIFSIIQFSLLQAVLSGVQIESVSLQMDGQKMVEIAERMACGLIDYFQAIQFERKCFSAILAATNLRKSLKLRAWSDSQFSQALKLPDADVNKLIQSGIRSVDSLLQRHPREIEDVCHLCHIKFKSDE